MKLKHVNELPLLAKKQSAQRISKLVLLVAISLVILILINLNNPYLLSESSSLITVPFTSHHTITITNPHAQDDDNLIITNKEKQHCDLFAGQWVPNPDAPYYNASCLAIHDHQNCMKYGRPDSEFIKWRWKPDGCELPIFNPYHFLEIMRGKSMAFVGDSVARNQVQSLFCLLSKVVYPIDVSTSTDENFRNWEYKAYNFNVSIFWSPYLVKTQRTDPNDVTQPFNLYLDEFDESWTTQIENFDYLVISAGHWFFRPSIFYVNRSLIGCLYCSKANFTHLPASFSYQMAFRTVFKAINNLTNYKGTTFLRSFAPSHFENGVWNKGGDCVRTRPYGSDEIALADHNLDMHNIQLQEFRVGEREGRDKGIKFRLIDVTRAMLMRPDGHPSKNGHWPMKNVSWPSDCVHWCLPGPVDVWNDFLLEMLMRENTS